MTNDALQKQIEQEVERRGGVAIRQVCAIEELIDSAWNASATMKVRDLMAALAEYPEDMELLGCSMDRMVNGDIFLHKIHAVPDGDGVFRPILPGNGGKDYLYVA